MTSSRILASFSALSALMMVSIWYRGRCELSPVEELTLGLITARSSENKPTYYTCSYASAGTGQATCDGCAGVPNADNKPCICCANDQLSDTGVAGGSIDGIKPTGANVKCAGNLKSQGVCYYGSCYSRVEVGMCVDPKTAVPAYTPQ